MRFVVLLIWIRYNLWCLLTALLYAKAFARSYAGAQTAVRPNGRAPKRRRPNVLLRIDLSFILLPAAWRPADPATSVYPGESRCYGSDEYEDGQKCVERKGGSCDKETKNCLFDLEQHPYDQRISNWSLQNSRLHGLVIVLYSLLSTVL